MEGVDLIDRTGRDDAEVAGRDRRDARLDEHSLADRCGSRSGRRSATTTSSSSATALPWELTPERIRRICEPHFGVGSDGILLLSRAEDAGHVAELRIFNPDGSEAELSGNGAREAVLYLREAGWTDADAFTILTKAGEVTPTITGPGTGLDGDRAGVADLRRLPRRGPRTAPGRSSRGGREWRFQHVNVGNPQCVIEVGDEVEAARPRRDRAADRAPPSCSRTAPTSRSSASTARGCGRGSSSAGWGRRSRRARAPAAPRSPPSSRGAPSPITVRLDGGELDGRGRRRARRDPDRHGVARLRGRARRRASCASSASSSDSRDPLG